MSTSYINICDRCDQVFYKKREKERAHTYCSRSCWKEAVRPVYTCLNCDKRFNRKSREGIDKNDKGYCTRKCYLKVHQKLPKKIYIPPEDQPVEQDYGIDLLKVWRKLQRMY